MLAHDILIVGAGLAGMRAAVQTPPDLDVAVISKVHPVRSHSVAAQGGINAAVSPEDSWQAHAFDTVKGSDYLGDQDAIETMCREGPEDIASLERMGAIFSRGEGSQIAQRPFGGMAYARTCYAADRTGHALVHLLYEQLLKRRLTIYEEWYVTSLIVEGGVCRGVVVWDLLKGGLHAIRAKAVIFATGGYGRVFATTTNGMVNTGDGMSMAYRAGLPLMDMEFVQFHPTTIKDTGILFSEAARGEGGYLINVLGERFMKRYAPVAMELASRDIVSRAEQQEIEEGRGVDGAVLLDLRHLGRDRIMERLPQDRALAITFIGVDAITTPVPVKPGAHYSMGGIMATVSGETEAAGFYAVGECACVSIHGANRLGGNGLLETIVFGRRTGQAAAEYARRTAPPEIPGAALERDRDWIEGLLRRTKGERHWEIRAALGQAMNTHAGVFRTLEKLTAGLEAIRDLKRRYAEIALQDRGRLFNTELLAAVELSSLLDLAEVSVTGALAREESRGAHSRRDFPKRDDARWLKHTLAYWTDTGPRLDYRDVTITHYPPKPRTY